MISDNNNSGSNPLTPVVSFTAKKDLYVRNTRPTGQRDMRPEAVATRRADPRSLNIGLARIDINEPLVDQIISNIRDGAGMKPAVVATGQVHPRIVHRWKAEGQTEYEWRVFGKPCEDCSEISGHPTGCSKCGSTGLIPYEPDITKDLNVKLFLGVPQARSEYLNSVDKVLTINATQTQTVTKETYTVKEGEIDPKTGIKMEGERVLKGVTVTQVLADWRACDVIRNRIIKGQQLQAFNQGISAQEFNKNNEQYDEIGILQFNTLFGVERNESQDGGNGPIDILPYLPRLSDEVKMQLALEVGQLIAEDQTAREDMRKDGDEAVLVVESEKD